jgi:hypothetical protein
LSDRRARFASQQHRKSIGRRARQIDAVEFFNVLTGPELLELTDAHLPEHRERLYSPTVTLSMFMQQALNEDGSCQKVVNGWAAQRAAEGLSASSIRTGSYCKARQRLPVEMVMALARASGRMLSTRTPGAWLWQGRKVKLVDGSGISMPDTAENQACYPQPSSQAKGVGFPLARMVAVICLSTGAVWDAAMGAFEGKGNGELGLLRHLSAAFSAGDVMLADALYCNYFVIAALQAAGVDAVFKQNGARSTDFRRGRKLGPRDHLVCWPKPCRPEWMTQEQFAAVPEQLMVREVKVGRGVIVTTMLDHNSISKSELQGLYGQRWHVELDLRNIKTTLGMDVLSCQTPRMNEKELWVHLLAYNLIRLLMAQAAMIVGVNPRQLSFKHTVQTWIAWIDRGLSTVANRTNCLFRLIAQIRVGDRPGRIEPRTKKRRPKSYPWLKDSRAKARRKVALHGHA